MDNFKITIAWFVSLLFIVGLVPFNTIVNIANVYAEEVNLANLESEGNVKAEGLKETQLQIAQTSSVDEGVSVKAFNIEGEGIINYTLQVTFKDGSVSEVLKIYTADGGYGLDSGEETTTVSQSFIFNKEIASVAVLGEGQVDFRLNYLNRTNERNINKSALTEVGQQKKDFHSRMGINLTVREEWGAPATSNWLPYITVPNKIVVHHTATSVDNSDPARIVRAIYDDHYHRCAYTSGYYNPNNPDCDEERELWEDIGYNYLIDQFGNIYEGRAGENGVVGAHSPPNSSTIGIGIIGNYQSNNITHATRDSLRKLMGVLSKLNNIDLNVDANVQGHRERNSTACPGTVLFNDLHNIVNEAKAYQTFSPSLNSAVDNVNSILDNDQVQIKDYSSTKYLITMKLDGVSSELKELTKNGMITSGDFREINNTLFFSIDKNYLRKELTEQYLQYPNLVVQPELIYTKNLWENSDPERSVPSDYDTDLTDIHWNLNMINQPEAWKTMGGCVSDELCGGDPSVIVAVLDTGVSYENYNYDAGGNYQLESFYGFNVEVPTSAANAVYNEGYDRQYGVSDNLDSANFVGGYDAAQDFFCQLRDGTSYPCNAAELEKINHGNDDDGHGTFVSTIIAADTGDSSPDRLVGIAHNTSIMPVKIFFPNDSSMCYTSLGNNDPTCSPANQGYGLRGYTTSTLIVWGIEYAVANGADVINMSISGGGYDQAVQDAINFAHASGVTVVVAAGNSNDDTANYFPSGMQNVINVGAVNPNGSKSSYSNYGSLIDVVAPVGNTIVSQWFSCAASDSCWREDTGNVLNSFTSNSNPATSAGTSFAAPQVSALVALMKSRDESLSPNQVEKIIKATSSNGINNGVSGYGIVNGELILENLWSGWKEYGGSTPSELISMEVFDGNLYQAVLGGDGRVFTRSFDGINWSNWQHTGGSGKGYITMKAYDGNLYQSIRGWDDRVFTRSFDGVNWTSWQHDGGRTVENISMEVYDGRLYQSINSTDRQLLTRSFDGASWSNFENYGGSGLGSIIMEVFDDKLFQSIRGNDGRIFNRSFDGVVWTNWQHTGGSAPKDVDLEVFNGNLYQIVPGWDGRIFLREFDGTDWSNWQYINQVTNKNVVIKAGESELFIVTVNSEGRILSNRLSMNAQLSSWLDFDGKTLGYVNMINFLGDIYHSVPGQNKKIYTRQLVN